MKTPYAKQSAFTIVELLIVIVVVGILATISVVAYTGIKNKALDTRVREGATQFEKALKLWAVEYGNRPLGGNGSTIAFSGDNCPDGNGNGFVGSGLYTCTTEDILYAKGYLPKNFTSSLPNNIVWSSLEGGSRSIMLYDCGSSGKYALYWTLRAPSSEDTSSIDSTITTCSNPANIRDAWGMRAGRIIQL